MPVGIVSTARGRALNLDELILQGQRPVGKNAKSTRVTTNYKPKAGNDPKVRGFVPMPGSAELPDEITIETSNPVDEGVTVVKNDKVVSSYSDDDDKEAKTVSDLTGIKLKKNPNSQRVKNAKAVAESEAAGEGDEELGDLMNELDGGDDKKAPAKTTRSTAKK